MGSFTSDFFKNNKAESSSISSSKKKKKKKNEIDVNNFTDSFFSNYGDDDLKVSILIFLIKPRLKSRKDAF